MLAFSSVRLPACRILTEDGNLNIAWERCLDSLLVDAESGEFAELSSERVRAIIYALACIAAEACSLHVGTVRRSNLQREVAVAALAYFSKRLPIGEAPSV